MSAYRCEALIDSVEARWRHLPGLLVPFRGSVVSRHGPRGKSLKLGSPCYGIDPVGRIEEEEGRMDGVGRGSAFRAIRGRIPPLLPSAGVSGQVGPADHFAHHGLYHYRQRMNDADSPDFIPQFLISVD